MQSLPSLSSNSQSSSSSSTDSSYRGRRIKKDVLLKRWTKIKPFRQDSETLHIADILRKLDKLKEAVENVRMDLDPDSGQPSCIQCRAETPSEFSLLSDIMSGNLLERASEIEQKLMEISSGGMNKHLKEDMQAVEKLEREICRIYPGIERSVHVARRIECNQRINGEREASTQEQKIIVDIETQNQAEQPQNIQFVVDKTADQNVYHRRKKNQYRQVVTTTEKVMKTDQQYVQIYDTILEDDGRGPFDRKILTQRSKTRLETIQGMNPTKEVVERRRTTRFIDNKTKEIIELISDLGNQSETSKVVNLDINASSASPIDTLTGGSTTSVVSNAKWVFRQPLEDEVPQGDFKSRWNLVKSRAYIKKSDDSIFTESLLTGSSSSDNSHDKVRVEKLQSGTNVSQMKRQLQGALGQKSVDVVYRKRSFDVDEFSDAFSRQQSFWVNTISYLSNGSRPGSRASSKHAIGNEHQRSASAIIQSLQSQRKFSTTDREPSWHSLSSCSTSTSEDSRGFPSTYYNVYGAKNRKHNVGQVPDRKSMFEENLSSKQMAGRKNGHMQNLDKAARITQNESELYSLQSQQASFRQTNDQSMHIEGFPGANDRQYIEDSENFTSNLPPLRKAEYAIISQEIPFRKSALNQRQREEAKLEFKRDAVYFIQEPMSSLRQASDFESKWIKEPASKMEKNVSSLIRNTHQFDQQFQQISRQKSQMPVPSDSNNSQEVNLFLEKPFPDGNELELSHGQIMNEVSSVLREKHPPNDKNGKSSHQDKDHLSSVRTKSEKSRSANNIGPEKGDEKISDEVSFMPSFTTLANPVPDTEPGLPKTQRRKVKSKPNYIDTSSDESNRSEDEEFVGQMFLNSRPVCDPMPENTPQKSLLSRSTDNHLQDDAECFEGPENMNNTRITAKQNLEVPKNSKESQATIIHSSKVESGKHLDEPSFVLHPVQSRKQSFGHHPVEVISGFYKRDGRSSTESNHERFSLEESQTKKTSKLSRNAIKTTGIDFGSGESYRHNASHFPEMIQTRSSRQPSTMNARSQAGQVSEEQNRTQVSLPTVFVMKPTNTNGSGITWQPIDAISSFQNSQSSSLPRPRISHNSAKSLDANSRNMSACKHIPPEPKMAPPIHSSVFASAPPRTIESSVVQIDKTDKFVENFDPTDVIYDKSSSYQEQKFPYSQAEKSTTNFDNMDHPSGLWHANTNQPKPVNSSIPRTVSMFQRPSIRSQSSRIVPSAHPSEHSRRSVASKSRMENHSRVSLHNIQHHHPSMRSIPISRQSVMQQPFLNSLMGVPNAQSGNQVAPHKPSGYPMKVLESQGTIRSIPPSTHSTLQNLQRSVSRMNIHMSPEPATASTNSVAASQTSVRYIDRDRIPRTHSVSNLGKLSTKEDIIQSLLTTQGQKSDESLIDHSGSEVLMVLYLDRDETPGSKSNKVPMVEQTVESTKESVVKIEEQRGMAGESSMRLPQENKEIHQVMELPLEHTGHPHSPKPMRKKKPTIKTRVEIHFPTGPTGNTLQADGAKEPEKKVGMADRAVSFAHFPEIRSYVVDTDKPLRKFRSKPNVTPEQDSSSNMSISCTQGSRNSLQQSNRSGASSTEQQTSKQIPERQKSGENFQSQKPQCLSNKLAPYFEVLLQDDEEKLEESRLRCLENLAKKNESYKEQSVAESMPSKPIVVPQQSKASASKSPPDKPISVSNYNLEHLFQSEKSKTIERNDEVVKEKSKAIVPEIVVVKPPSDENVKISKKTQVMKSATTATDKNFLPVQPEKRAPSQSNLQLNALFADASRTTTHSKAQSIKSGKDIGVQNERTLETQSNLQPEQAKAAQKQSELQTASKSPTQKQQQVAQSFIQKQEPTTQQASQISTKQSMKAVPQTIEPESNMVRLPESLKAIPQIMELEPSVVESSESLSTSQSGSTLSEQGPEQVELVSDLANQPDAPNLETIDEISEPTKQPSTILEKVLSLIHPLTSATAAPIVTSQSNLKEASNISIKVPATVEPARSRSQNQIFATNDSAANEEAHQSKPNLTSTTALIEPLTILETVKSQTKSTQNIPSLAAIPRDENLSKLKSVSNVFPEDASKVVIPNLSKLRSVSTLHPEGASKIILNETVPQPQERASMAHISPGPEPPTQAENNEARIFVDPVAMIKKNLGEPRLESGQQPEKEKQSTRPNLPRKSHAERKREIRRTIRKPPEPPKSFFVSKFLSKFLSKRLTSEEELYRERRYLQIAVVDDPEEIPEGDSMMERFRCYSVRSRTLHLTDSEIDVLCTKKAERVKKEARQLRRGRSKADFTLEYMSR